MFYCHSVARTRVTGSRTYFYRVYDFDTRDKHGAINPDRAHVKTIVHSWHPWSGDADPKE